MAFPACDWKFSTVFTASLNMPWKTDPDSGLAGVKGAAAG